MYFTLFERWYESESINCINKNLNLEEKIEFDTSKEEIDKAIEEGNENCNKGKNKKLILDILNATSFGLFFLSIGLLIFNFFRVVKNKQTVNNLRAPRKTISIKK